MKGYPYRQWLVLVAVIGFAASISSAVPVPGDSHPQRSRLYGSLVNKRASHPSMVVATEPEYLEDK